MRIAFVSQEVWPFVPGGGIGRYVWTAAATLAPHHEVTIVTSAAHRREGQELGIRGVEVVWVDEPVGDVRPLRSDSHAWSFRLLEAVRALRPDVVEFGDYLGEGFCTVHARRGGDPALRSTAVVVRAHTSAELTAGLNETRADGAIELMWAMERFPIRHADAFLWPGGDVLERYRAQYGSIRNPVRVSLPVRLDELEPPAEAAAPPAEGPLRLLYLNRLERRKGILELLEAVRDRAESVQLTVVGGDTPTAPGGGSMLEHVRALIEGWPHVSLRGRIDHAEVPALIAAHHAVAVPVRWETFSYVTREALAANRPVLATPAGAIVDVVRAGESGWIGLDLGALLDEATPATALELIAAGGPRRALEASMVSAEELAAAYEAAPHEWQPAPVPARMRAVVHTHRGDAGLRDTLRSLATQRGVQLDVTVAGEPEALAPASTLLAANEVSAPGFSGGETSTATVLHVPAGAVLDPEFTRRAAESLHAGVTSVTAFAARGREPHHAPVEPAEASVRLVGSGDAEGLVIHEPLVRRVPRRGGAAAVSPRRR